MELDRSVTSTKIKNSKKTPNNFLICIQNSVKSYYTLIAAINLMNKSNDKLTLIHIHDLRLSYKEETEKKNLETKYKKFLESENVVNYSIIMNSKKKDMSFYEQIKDIAEDETVTPTHMFIGYSDPRKQNSLVLQTDYSKYLNNSFIINRINIPCIMIKNKITRETNRDKNFKWLVFLKSGDNISFYALIKLMAFIDIKVDEIYAFHINYESSKENNKELEGNFIFISLIDF